MTDVTLRTKKWTKIATLSFPASNVPRRTDLIQVDWAWYEVLGVQWVEERDRPVREPTLIVQEVHPDVVP